MAKMNPKWLGFLIFVWLIGAFLGATYEKDFNTSMGSSQSTLTRLLTPTETKWETSTGTVSWWNPSSGYWGEWLKVLVWDFPFLKAYDTNLNGVIDAAEAHNNDIGVYAGYFLHAFGIVGLAALIFAMFEFFQGFIPGS